MRDNKKPLTRLEQAAKMSLEVEDVRAEQIEKVFVLLAPLDVVADATDCRKQIAIFITNIWWSAASNADAAMVTDKEVKRKAGALAAAIARLENAAEPFRARLDDTNRLLRGNLYALSNELEIEPELIDRLAVIKRRAIQISAASSGAGARDADYKRYAMTMADRLIDLYSSLPLMKWSRKARTNLAHALLGETPPSKRSGMERYSAKPGLK